MEKENCFLLLDSKVGGDGCMISQWTHIQGRAGMTHRIHMESCLLHVSTRPSIWKPLLNLSKQHWTCHVINTPPWWSKTFKWKVSAPGAVRVKQQHTICSLHSLLFCIAHHDPIREGKERGTWLVCFVILEQDPAEVSSVNQCKPDGKVWTRRVRCKNLIKNKKWCISVLKLFTLLSRPGGSWPFWLRSP